RLHRGRQADGRVWYRVCHA
ncbi:hypothetical protein BN1708_020693, partial [Verticillium longisporum]